MDDRSSSPPLTIKRRSGSVRELLTQLRRFPHHTAQSADKPEPVFPPHLGRKPR